MTRFACLAVAGCMLSALLSTPAYAGPILPDPSIGIRGGDDGSPDVHDGSAQALSALACGGAAVLAGSFCAPYQFSSTNSEFQIFALELAFWNATGTPIPHTVAGDCDGPCRNFNVDARSQLGVISFNEDGFTVRLSSDGGGIGFLFPEGSGPFTRDLLVFVAPFDQFTNEPFTGGFVSIQRVNNETPNANRETPGKDLTSVPEPSSLLLLATGLVGLVGRRRLRRKGGR